MVQRLRSKSQIWRFIVERLFYNGIGKENRRYWAGVLVFFLSFTILYVVLRLPFYRYPLMGEDGLFADIFLNGRHGPSYAYIFVARLNNTDIYIPASHPALMYEFIGIYGKVFQYLWPFGYLDLTNTLRLAFSLPQLAIWMGFILLLANFGKPGGKIRGSLWYIVIVGILSVTILSVLTSAELQIDSSYGVLITGIFSLVWFYAMVIGTEKKRTIVVLFFIAGIVQGTGKNEVAIAFQAVSLFALGYCLLIKVTARDNNNFIECGFILAGLSGSILGCGINYLTDPKNYLWGFYLMVDLLTRDYASWNYMVWLSQFSSIKEVLMPLILMIFIAGIFGLYRLFDKRSPNRSLYIWFFTYSVGFLLPYLFHSIQLPRYYAPTLPLAVALMLYIMIELKTEEKLNTILSMHFLIRKASKPPSTFSTLSISQLSLNIFRLFTGIVVIFILITSLGQDLKWMEAKIYITNNFTKQGLYNTRLEQTKQAKRTGCLAVVDASFGIFYPGLDFIANSMDNEAIEYYAKLANKLPCGNAP